VVGGPVPIDDQTAILRGDLGLGIDREGAASGRLDLHVVHGDVGVLGALEARERTRRVDGLDDEARLPGEPGDLHPAQELQGLRRRVVLPVPGAIHRAPDDGLATFRVGLDRDARGDRKHPIILRSRDDRHHDLRTVAVRHHIDVLEERRLRPGERASGVVEGLGGIGVDDTRIAIRSPAVVGDNRVTTAALRAPRGARGIGRVAASPQADEDSTTTDDKPRARPKRGGSAVHEAAPCRRPRPPPAGRWKIRRWRDSADQSHGRQSSRGVHSRDHRSSEWGSRRFAGRQTATV
jgi:hypothetical protein